jgi:hypothetical protein
LTLQTVTTPAPTPRVWNHAQRLDQRIDRLDQRIDRLDQRIDRLDQRIDRLDQRIDSAADSGSELAPPTPAAAQTAKMQTRAWVISLVVQRRRGPQTTARPMPALISPAHGPASTTSTRPWAVEGLDDVELATLEWVDWHNNQRLHTACHDLTPVEYEQISYGQHPAQQAVGVSTPCLRTRRGGSAVRDRVESFLQG